MPSRPGYHSAGFGPDREVFRLAPPVIVWWVWLAFVVANIADVTIQGVSGSSGRFVMVVTGILATVTGLAYALALRPRVIAHQAGLTIVNPFRDHRVPWGRSRRWTPATGCGCITSATGMRPAPRPARPASPSPAGALYLSAPDQA